MSTSLSEILSAKGDADYADGGEGAAVSPYNNALALEYLGQAADVKARTNQYLLEQHDQNLQNAIKESGNVDFVNLMPQDTAPLQEQYSGLLKDQANNFSVLRNPMSNPGVAASLKNSESQFRTQLAQSQSDAAFLRAQQAFVQAHPEYDTPQYKQQVAAFTAAPVGQRQQFALTPPQVVNYDALGKTFGELAKQKYANASTNGKYISTSEGEKIDRDKYLQLWANPGKDALGRQIEQGIQNDYDSLPANLKANYHDFSDYKHQMALTHMPEDQQTKAEVKTDEYGLNKQTFGEGMYKQHDQQAFEAAQNKIKDDLEQQRIDISQNKEKVDPNAIGQYKNALYYNLTNGQSNTENVPNAALQDVYGDNSKVTVKTGDKALGKEVDQDVPKTEVIGNWQDDKGNVIIKLRNNTMDRNNKGGGISFKKIPFNQVYTDLNNIKGANNAPIVESGATKWLQKTTGSNDPDDPRVKQFFQTGSIAPPDNAGATPVVNNQQAYDALPKGATYQGPDGKLYKKN